MSTGIEWTDETWNPVSGCSKVSEGCRNCYAEGIDKRFNADHKPWTAPNAAHNVRLHPERLDKPLHWKKPRKIFVNSMSDLFHERVPDEFIDYVFAIMALTPKHTFQILTKRPGRMCEYVAGLGNSETASKRLSDAAYDIGIDEEASVFIANRTKGQLPNANPGWPLTNVWLGVSVEDQRAADERIPLLLQTPAAVRFLSCEPLLGPADLTRIELGTKITGHGSRRIVWDVLSGWEHQYSPERKSDAVPNSSNSQNHPSIDWVIVGGESGPNARPMHPDWARSLRDQCQEAFVPFLFKQWGEWLLVESGGVRYGDICLSDDGEREVADKNYVCFGNESGGALMRKVGKKSAGRFLDGLAWDEYPVTQP